jgi:hypothetical protein
MKTSSLLVSTALWALLLPATAFADARSAATCAASLTASQKLIYQSVLPDLKRETDLPTLVRAKVMALVTAGRLQMSSAPDDAQVAASCLQMVHQ